MRAFDRVDTANCSPTRHPRDVSDRGRIKTMDHKQQIKQFVLKNYLFTDDENALTDSDSLIRNGTIDSTGMLELISHLEETYSIKVADVEMIPAHFDSIDAIGAFVASKLAA
jgi:acyl carrier protein